MKTFLTTVFVLASSAAYADDHMIRPTCWEENKDGQIYRHCEVNRPPSPQPPPVVQQRPQDLHQAYAPEPPMPPPFYDQYGRPRYPNPPGYYGPPPGSYEPGPGYYPPGPLGIPGPLAVFRFGPFTFVIP